VDDETASDLAVSTGADGRRGRPEAAYCCGASPTIGNVRIGGYAYDLQTGKIATVVEPS